MQQTLPHGGGLPARKKRRFGCLGAIIFSLAFGAVVYLVVIAVIAPWGYFLGGHFHLLPGWQGLGRLHSATAGDYLLYLWIYPRTRGGSRVYGNSGVSGTALLCTPHGEQFSLRVGGGMPKSWMVDTDGQPLHIYLYRRPWNYNFVAVNEHPKLDFRGQWHNPDLIMDEHGTLSQEFTADGHLYSGAPQKRPQASETIHVDFKSASRSDFDVACKAMANAEGKK
jgi:hypothetical protein